MNLSNRPMRRAKERALEIIVGNISDDEDEASTLVENEEGDTDDLEDVNEISENLDEINEENLLDDNVVFWPSDEDSDFADEELVLPFYPQPSEYSSDGAQWTPDLPRNIIGRQRRQNVFTGIPGLIRRGVHPQNEKEAFLIFADCIIKMCSLC
jgi:hypothetical protein